ncbi:hypothetical protein C8R46DRAFT_497580 [Mycena filopes]|nr:hypothetical protein C8R46DRAFT_497580 [Mycena filopes]
MFRVLQYLGANRTSFRFLAVIWPILDPARIPPIAALDCHAPSRAAVAPLAMAYHALAALRLIDPPCVPMGVYAALWPRVWTWMELIQIYRPLLPQIVAADPLRHRFLVDVSTRPLIHATPGIYTFAGLTWSTISLKHHVRLELGALEGLHYLLVTSNWRPAHMEELLDGVGGIQVLAKLVVQQISALSTYFNNFANGSYINFLAQFLGVVAAWGAHRPDLQHAFRQARLVRALTATLITLAEIDLVQPGVDLTDAGLVLKSCFTLLRDLICEQRRFPRLAEALRAGLLRALVSVGTMGLPGIDSDPYLEYFLCHILSPAMVYHPVVAATRGNCPSLPITGPANDRFMKSSVVPKWLSLLAVIAARTSALEVFQSPRYLSLRFCDNYIKCQNVKLASDIKCCSGCRGAHYCSTECQRTAWNNGHRELCVAVNNRRKSPA